jgi:predicted unusual protein kinase regulating ubiquinone biosynthesis (AarF/ABC1/UbiB family)
VQGIKDAGIDVEAFITVGVSAALRQLLEFGLFHGDPHPGNIFAMRDGRIAYVDFGNVAELSQVNKNQYFVSKWMINASIKAFFSQIFHQWILDNFPMPLQ